MKYSKKVFAVNLIIAAVLQLYLIGINCFFTSSYERNLIRFAYAYMVYILFFSISMRKYLDFTRKLKNPAKKWVVILAGVFGVYSFISIQFGSNIIRGGVLFQILHCLMIVFIISNHFTFKKYNNTISK